MLSVSPLAFAQEYAGITKPSGDVALAFVRPGKVDNLHVKEGDPVKAGQVLVELDNTAEQVQVAQLKAQAENTMQMTAAKLQLDQSELELKRYQAVAGVIYSGVRAVTDLEVERAELEVRIARLRAELAEFEHTQDQLKYQEALKQLERMRLVSPIEGRVEKLVAKAGEAADALTPVIRVVNIDPLYVEVFVQREVASALRVGGSAEVRFVQPTGKSALGKIIHISQVADAASDTLMVRVELPNPTVRAAGERVTVKYVQEPQAAQTPQSGEITAVSADKKD